MDGRRTYDQPEQPPILPSTPSQSWGNDTAGDSIMRTVVSREADALEVLFNPIYDGSENRGLASRAQRMADYQRRTRLPGRLNESSPVMQVWSACRFVKQGWFSATEAIFYVDMFSQHLNTLSPIVTDFFSRPENHYQLVSSEPLLCCTILAVSARYNALPGAGGLMRSFYIHDRLWGHIKHLIMRILIGQEKKTKAKTRTLGTVESLLLLTEWPPRSLAFPPPVDGWDSDLLVYWPERNEPALNERENDARERWIEDVLNPTRRSGHMSWMLTSCALSLACEIGVFEDDGDRQPPLGKDTISCDITEPGRLIHLQNLLYLYAEQISLHLGCQSILPQAVSQRVTRQQRTTLFGGYEDLHTYTTAWLKLTQITRHMMEVLFSSPSQVSRLLQSGRYVHLIEHFQPTLLEWKAKYLDNHQNDISNDFRDFLQIEYLSAQLYCHSLGVQAVIERKTTSIGPGFSERGYTPQPRDNNNDFFFIEEVVNCATAILRLATRLSIRQILTFVPSRVTLRIIAASVFLLKGLGLGVGEKKLESSLQVLDESISALKLCAVDEMHLGVRHAELVEMHLTRLKNNFVSYTGLSNQADIPVQISATSHQTPPGGAEDVVASLSGNVEDWLGLPFDFVFPSTETSDLPGFANLDDSDLDFLWNLDSSAGNNGDLR